MKTRRSFSPIRPAILLCLALPIIARAHTTVGLKVNQQAVAPLASKSETLAGSTKPLISDDPSPLLSWRM